MKIIGIVIFQGGVLTYSSNQDYRINYKKEVTIISPNLKKNNCRLKLHYQGLLDDYLSILNL